MEDESSTERRIGLLYQRKIEDALSHEGFTLDDVESGNHDAYKILRNTVRESYDELGKIRRKFSDEYKLYLSNDETIFSHLQWLRQTMIRENLYKKRSRGLLPVMECLAKNKLDYNASKRLTPKLGLDPLITLTGNNEEKKRYRVFVIPDFYKIKFETGISKPDARKYLQGACDIQILFQHKRGCRPSIYSMGYWYSWMEDGESKFRPIWFLKNTTQIRQSLRDFCKP